MASEPQSIGSGGIHDYGGRPFADLPPPPKEVHELFEWEKNVDALVGCLVAKKIMTVDMLRRGIERCLLCGAMRGWVLLAALHRKDQT